MLIDHLALYICLEINDTAPVLADTEIRYKRLREVIKKLLAAELLQALQQSATD